MATTYAWYSAAAADRFGSMIYRKRDGSTVDVTRMNLQKEPRRPPREGKAYVGVVIRKQDGGCIRGKKRADATHG